MVSTVGGALEDAAGLLGAAGVESPRWDAQILLAWTLKVRREDLAREPGLALAARERVIFEKAVSLRALRRPLPYITGEAWFYGRPFKINRAVLIPRPETEELARAALDALQTVPVPRVADVGTGSGCLAVTLALESPQARVWATDLSVDALKTARKNVARYGLGARVALLQGDLLAPLSEWAREDGPRLDAIVSNPPYVSPSELPDLQPEVRDYEPALALAGEDGAAGPDGMGLHRRLIADSPTVLAPHGRLLLEVGRGQAQPVAHAAQAAGYTEVAILNDLSGIGRVVTARRPEPD